MTKPIRLRTTLSATTILAAGLMLAAAPARAQSLPDTGNVTAVTSGLSGGAPGSTNPTIITSGAPGAQTLRVDLKDNRTILNWGGSGFDIAAGNTVDFKDARATSGVTGRTDNIAVLNRDLSGVTSFVHGTIKSDPNVAVYLVNSGGIIFGGSAVVNTGSFWASTLGVTDADFLDGDHRLSFSTAVGQDISLNSGARITTATNAGTTGDRMGDIVFVSNTIRMLGANATSLTAQGGDIALVAGRDIVVQHAPGSPLSLVVNRGSAHTFTDPQITGKIDATGRNITIAAINADASNFFAGISIQGSLVATGAAQTDRGIVLTSTLAAPGVVLGSPPSSAPGSLIGAATDMTLGSGGFPAAAMTLQSASGISLSSKGLTFNSASVQAAGAISISGRSIAVGSTPVTGGSVTFSTPDPLSYSSISASGQIVSTQGDIVFGDGLHLFSSIQNTVVRSARDILATSMGSLQGGARLEAGRNISLVAKDFILNGITPSISAGGSIYLRNSDNTGSIIGNTSLTSGGDVTLLSSRTINLYDVTATGGKLTATGGKISLGLVIADAGALLRTNPVAGLTGDINLRGAAISGVADFEVDASGLLSVNTVTAGRDILVRATGDVGFNTSGSTAGRNISISGATIFATNLEARTGFVSATAGNRVSVSGGAKAGSYVLATGRSVDLDLVTAGTGDITVTATAGEATLKTATAAGSILLSATGGQAKLWGNVSAGGNLSVVGDGINVAGVAGRDIGPWLQRAAGSVTYDGRTGSVSMSPQGTVQSNSDGIGDEALTLQTSAGLDLWSTNFLGGTNRQSDVLFRYGANRAVWLGGVTARSLQGAQGNAAFSSDIVVSGPWLVFNGNLDLTNSVSLRAPSVTVSGVDIRAGDFSIYSGAAIDIGYGVKASGNILLTTSAGNLTIGSGGLLSGTDVVLSTPAAFKNLRGADAITASGRWLVYSANPAGDTFGGLDSGNTAIWNATLATRAPSTLTGNRYVFTQRPTLTFSTVDFSKVYGTGLNGSAAIPFAVSGYHAGVAGAFLGDTAATAYSGNPLIQSAGFAERASVAGGPYAQTIAQGSVQSTSGYALAFAPSTGLVTVTPKAITGSIAADNKIYDGTTAGTGSVFLNGVVTGDTVSTTGAVFTFADKNAGAGKVVNITGTTLTGADSGNYTLTVPASALADILKKALTMTATANGKVYDGTAATTGTISLNGVIVGDTVETTGSVFTFADKNAGSSKVVNVSGTALSGADAGNYTLTLPATALADILKKAISGSIAADNKIYDGGTTGTGTVSLNGVVAGDTVGTTGSVFTFADKNAGSGKTVAITGTTLTGADSGNYTLTVPASALADILKKALTLTATANSKTYDGTTNATGSVSLNGVVAGETVGTTGSVFTFADKNAGTGKAVNVTGTTLTGADSGNYTLTLPASALADILQKALTATVSAYGKIYDGTTTATGSVALNGVVSGDTVSTGGITFTFADKNAGSGKAVAVGGGLSGADAGNYTVSLPASVLADILKKAITANAAVDSKTYDGSTAATGALTLNGVVTGDAVGTAGSVFTFADKNASTGKTVAISGATLTGADSGNYTLTAPASVLADIFKKAITANAAVDSKTYDGSTTATGSLTLNGVVAGDTIGTSGTSFAFSDKNAGAGKVVNVTGTTLTGADSGNYTLTVPASSLADILKKSLTATVSANGKTYDGTTAATGSVSLNGVVSGDAVSTGGVTFTFADKNAGTGKAVAVGGGLSGADAGNYTVSLPASVLADILKKSLTATVSANGKTYDGTTATTGSVALNGVVSGDTVSTGGITFTFADRNAGSGKAVAVGGGLSGADAGNYTVNLPASVLADILKKSLTVTVTANGKTYDGTTAATGSVALNGVVAGDTVGTSGTALAFEDRNAGTGKAVKVTGTTLTGTDSGNYTLIIPARVLADIAKRALSVNADDKAKYTGEVDPALTYTISLGSLVAGDQLSGALARAAGAGPGDYAIGQGTLSAGSNYTLTFTPGTLTISVNPATSQQQTLRAVPLPSGIQAPPNPSPGVSIDANALCAEDKSCVAN